MPAFQHPFASSRYARVSSSAETLGRWLRGEKHTEEGSPSPALPDLGQRPEPVMVPADSCQGLSLPQVPVDINIPESSAKSSPEHYVMHSSKVTVLLSGQRSGTDMPVYTNGATIDGILAAARPSGLLALEVMVHVQFPSSRTAGLTCSRLRAE